VYTYDPPLEGKKKVSLQNQSRVPNNPVKVASNKVEMNLVFEEQKIPEVQRLQSIG
jgi:hypothetical protein